MQKLLTIALLQVIFTGNAQVIIRGEIVDVETQNPLTGVNIWVKTTAIYGSTSNQEGRFNLKIPENADTIFFSYMGYKLGTRVIPIDDQSWRIELEPDIKELKEVLIEPEDPVQLIKQVIARFPQNYPESSYKAKGFLRQMIKDSKDYLSIGEAVFDINYFPKEKSRFELKIIKARTSDDVKRSRLF